ncbi:hypothetical protein ACIRBY_37120 [Streptomyces sp. NPDC096136]|uniref:hypothetical protein n=1 Tax=Streptomyces sp. NPDC096136 TaxID=3366076 RepID=UPI0038244CD4
MANSLDLEATLRQARELMERRIASVEAHKRNVDAESAARAELTEREQNTARTWSDLLRAGWSVEELRSMGFREPTAKAPKRINRARKGEDPAPAPEAHVPAQPVGTSGSVPTPQ